MRPKPAGKVKSHQPASKRNLRNTKKPISPPTSSQNSFTVGSTSTRSRTRQLRQGAPSVSSSIQVVASIESSGEEASEGPEDDSSAESDIEIELKRADVPADVPVTVQRVLEIMLQKRHLLLDYKPRRNEVEMTYWTACRKQVVQKLPSLKIRTWLQMKKWVFSHIHDPEQKITAKGLNLANHPREQKLMSKWLRHWRYCQLIACAAKCIDTLDDMFGDPRMRQILNLVLPKTETEVDFLPLIVDGGIWTEVLAYKETLQRANRRTEETHSSAEDVVSSAVALQRADGDSPEEHRQPTPQVSPGTMKLLHDMEELCKKEGVFRKTQGEGAHHPVTRISPPPGLQGSAQVCRPAKPHSATTLIQSKGCEPTKPSTESRRATPSSSQEVVLPKLLRDLMQSSPGTPAPPSCSRGTQRNTHSKTTLAPHIPLTATDPEPSVALPQHPGPRQTVKSDKAGLASVDHSTLSSQGPIQQPAPEHRKLVEAGPVKSGFRASHQHQPRREGTAPLLRQENEEHARKVARGFRGQFESVDSLRGRLVPHRLADPRPPPEDMGPGSPVHKPSSGISAAASNGPSQERLFRNYPVWNGTHIRFQDEEDTSQTNRSRVDNKPAGQNLRGTDVTAPTLLPALELKASDHTLQSPKSAELSSVRDDDSIDREFPPLHVVLQKGRKTAQNGSSSASNDIPLLRSSTPERERAPAAESPILGMISPQIKYENGPDAMQKAGASRESRCPLDHVGALDGLQEAPDPDSEDGCQSARGPHADRPRPQVVSLAILSESPLRPADPRPPPVPLQSAGQKRKRAASVAEDAAPREQRKHESPAISAATHSDHATEQSCPLTGPRQHNYQRKKPRRPVFLEDTPTPQRAGQRDVTGSAHMGSQQASHHGSSPAGNEHSLYSEITAAGATRSGDVLSVRDAGLRSTSHAMPRGNAWDNSSVRKPGTPATNRSSASSSLFCRSNSSRGRRHSGRRNGAYDRSPSKQAGNWRQPPKDGRSQSSVQEQRNRCSTTDATPSPRRIRRSINDVEARMAALENTLRTITEHSEHMLTS